MVKHTQGPWRIRELVNGTLAVYGKGEYDIIFPKKSTTIDSNARLIAAAPELLEACKEVRKLYDELSMSTLQSACKYGDQYEPPTREECLEIREMLEQAIAKAEGSRK